MHDLLYGKLDSSITHNLKPDTNEKPAGYFDKISSQNGAETDTEA